MVEPRQTEGKELQANSAQSAPAPEASEKGADVTSNATVANTPIDSDANLPAVAGASPDHTDALQETAAATNVGGISIRVLNAIMILMVAAVSVVFLQGVQLIQTAHTNLDAASTMYMVCENAANDLREASADLTSDVRAYAVTQNEDYLKGYYNEVLVEQRREKAVEIIREHYITDQTLVYLERALQSSNDLMIREQRAIMLVASVKGHDLKPYAESLGDLKLSAADLALSDEEKIELATSLVYDDEYSDSVDRIMSDVQLCKETLVQDLGNAQEETSQTMGDLLLRQQVITWVLLAVVVIMILLFIALILRPLRHYIVRVRENEPLPGTGATELRSLSHAYNIMYEENLKNHAALRKEAEHDFLTGLLNRGAFDRLLKAYRNEPYALLLIDADHFKEINDNLGHDGGDAMLRKISSVLSHAFRNTDYACRIGGDEFAVVMTDMHEGLSHVISTKLKNVTDALRDTSDGLPVMTLSIGVAFNDGTQEPEAVFKNADNALYHVKEAGRDDFAFYQGE